MQQSVNATLDLSTKPTTIDVTIILTDLPVKNNRVEIFVRFVAVFLSGRTDK